MVVLITNVTDALGGKHPPTQVDVYNKTLDPGSSLRIPAELIDKRVRALATAGLIAIGALPSWYTAAKARTGKRITDEEKKKLVVRVLPLAPPKKEKPAPPKVTPVEPEKIEPQDLDPNRKR
jgi:hypothetical protein